MEVEGVIWSQMVPTTNENIFNHSESTTSFRSVFYQMANKKNSSGV